MNIRSVSLLVGAAIAVSLFAGCSSQTTSTPEATVQATAATSAAPAQKVRIRMSNWLETEDATKKIFRTMLDAFTTANPNITVETVGIPFANYKDQILITAAANDATDVIMGNSQMMSAFEGAGVLEPLEGLVKKEVLDDMIPNFLAGTTYNGKVKALSWAPHPIALFYNKELFTKAGLDPEKPPKTWDEMVDDAKKIAALKKDKDGNQIFGIANSNSKEAHAGTVTMGILYAFGGEFVDKNGKVAFDNQGTRDTFRYFKDLVAAGVMPAPVVQKDIRGLFASGRLGMCFDADMGRGVFRSSSGKGTEFDKIMGYTLIPAGKTGKSETVYTEHELAVGAKARYKKEGALLIEHLLSKDMMVAYHKDQAVMSARKSISALPEMNEDNYMKVFNEQSRTARPLPVTSNMFDNAMLEVAKGLERVTLNNEDIDKVVRETGEKVDKLYSGK